MNSFEKEEEKMYDLLSCFCGVFSLAWVHCVGA